MCFARSRIGFQRGQRVVQPQVRRAHTRAPRARAWRFVTHTIRPTTRMASSKPKWYGAVGGRDAPLAIYRTWAECHRAVTCVPGARFKAFATEEACRAWLDPIAEVPPPSMSPSPSPSPTAAAAVTPSHVVYTDGGCEGNGTDHARAGSGVYCGGELNDPKNLSIRLPGPHQTNNRAELFAALLGVLSAPAADEDDGQQWVIRTDSQYTINSATLWQEAPGRPNWDLIHLLRTALADRPHVRLEYVRGHQGEYGNECADQLAACALK